MNADRGNQVIRRGGRPNRGGGNKRGRGGGGRGARGGGPRGGPRGRGSSNKGGGLSRKQDLYDYDDDLPVVNEQYDRDYDVIKQKSVQAPRRFPKTRVAMQRLHMTSENQEMVRDMLKNLHGDDQDDSSGEPEYDELDWRAEDQYWMADNKLKVEAIESNHAQTEEQAQEKQMERYTQLAVDKLMRYGLDKSRCREALTLHNGDIGQALEYLLSQCFSLKWKPPLSRDPDRNLENDSTEIEDSVLEDDLGDAEWDDLYEQRTEEKLALESIYGENFKENIANRVWIIVVDMPILSKLSSELAAGNKKKSKYKENAYNVYNIGQGNLCRYYIKGDCRFGSRCKFKHPSPVEETGSQNDEGASNSGEYQLEIRFPENNKYPLEPPFIAFHSTNSLLPQYVCLTITSRLMNETKMQCDAGLPVVYSLVSLLESEEEVTALFEAPAVPFSLPPPVISRKQAKQAELSKQSNSAKNPTVKKDSYRDCDVSEVDFEVGGMKDDLVADVGPAQPEPEVKHSVRREVMPKRVDRREVERINIRLKQQFRKTKDRSDYRSMLHQRQQLPAWTEQENILEALESNQVLVVSGMTGCGKTTQVPQFLLDKSLDGKGPDVINIVCTQPRRISAIAVSERVASERAEKLGNTVGYQIRLESVMSSRTRLLFCTTGILLRRLEGETSLDGITHVIVDEVHERSEESDFLLLILRDLLPNRPDLRIILMSATLNADLFSDYFGGCPVIDIPGRTFPVEQFFLEDAIELTGYVLEENSPFSRPLRKQNAVRQDTKKPIKFSIEELEQELELVNLSSGMPPKDNIMDQNLTPRQLFLRFSGYKKATVKTMALMDYEKINLDLIENIIEWVVFGKHEFPQSGAILVFLPGYAEIQSMFDQLKSSHVTGGRNKARFKIIPLHSTLSSEDQQAVFQKPKDGVTKIVLSTNIAETSVTIDDVVFVIDCGLMKEKRYDPSKGMESLDTVWVSRANAQQRKGRAGRVASGVCFHLFTHHRFDWHLRDQPIPEIQRVPLEQTILKIKILPVFQGLDMEEVMYRLIEAPSDVSIQSAVKRLQDLAALDERMQLTPLGYHLAALPVDVRIGKLMLFGAIFRCLDPALTIAASLSFKSPFVAPFGKKEEATAKKLEFAVGSSDHLTMLKAYKGWCEAEKQSSYRGYNFCQENFLSVRSLQMLSSMKRQFAELLSDIGFIKEGISSRDLERLARQGGDGVIQGCGQEANSNSENYKLVAAILVAALYPNVVQVFTPENKYHQSSAGAVLKPPKPEEIKFKTRLDGYVNIHPSSVNFQVRYYESPYLVFHEKMKTSKVFIRDCTMVSVYPIILFGGGIKIDLDKGNFVLSVDDGWIRFIASSHEVAELVRELRLELDQLMKDKIEQPTMDLCTCPRGNRIINTIVKLITTQ